VPITSVTVQSTLDSAKTGVVNAGAALRAVAQNCKSAKAALVQAEATISALAAIVGSLTGALASSVSTWITQRHQDRRDLLAKRVFHREQLYSDFISESAHALADAIQHEFRDPNKLAPTYALVGRIRLSSSTDVLASAERVIRHILSTYSAPNLTPEEIQSGAGKREDPLREVSRICRAELETMQEELR
jgi:hypothetical protein